MNHLDRILRGEPARLLVAGLELARDEYPHLDIAGYVAVVDGWRELLRQAVASQPHHDPLGLINQLFFEDLRFRGNIWNYYDARNSYLNEVIDRRLGIPISLAIVYVDLAESIGLALRPVNLPGHLMLRFATPGGLRYLDVFGLGKAMTWGECAAFLEAMFGAPVGPEETLAAPMSDRQLLVRLLRNLKGIFVRDPARALMVQRRLVQLAPMDVNEHRDLGQCWLEAGHPREALAVFERIVHDHPALANDYRLDAGIHAARRALIEMN